MADHKPFSIGARLRSLGYAFAGIGLMLRTQHNAWVHLAATIVVCVAGFTLHVTADEWRWLVAAIVIVWIGETLNTAFEHLCDVVSPDFHVSVKRSKDIAAGAVFICAMGAIIIGASVFVPYLIR